MARVTASNTPVLPPLSSHTTASTASTIATTASWAPPNRTMSSPKTLSLRLLGTEAVLELRTDFAVWPDTEALDAATTLTLSAEHSDFLDEDHDGVRDEGEDGLPDLVIHLDETRVLVTDAEGRFAAGGLAALGWVVMTTPPQRLVRALAQRGRSFHAFGNGVAVRNLRRRRPRRWRRGSNTAARAWPARPRAAPHRGSSHRQGEFGERARGGGQRAGRHAEPPRHPDGLVAGRALLRAGGDEDAPPVLAIGSILADDRVQYSQDRS